MVGSFYKMVKAYTTEEGRFVLKFTDSFTCGMATQGGGAETLRLALSVVMGKAVSPSDISTEVEQVQTKDESLLDLILEAAEED